MRDINLAQPRGDPERPGAWLATRLGPQAAIAIIMTLRFLGCWAGGVRYVARRRRSKHITYIRADSTGTAVERKLVPPTCRTCELPAKA